jgi:hypothetical protein
VLEPRRVLGDVLRIRRRNPVLVSWNFSNFRTVSIMWGEWGSNPRSADYEKRGHMHRVH